MFHCYTDHHMDAGMVTLYRVEPQGEVDRPQRHGNRNLRGSKTTAILPLAVMVVVLLAAAGTFVATIHLSGLLMQRIQHLQRYNDLEPSTPMSGTGGDGGSKVLLCVDR